MSRQKEQKIKLLSLFDILDRQTDENHPMDTNQIIEELSAKGIEVSRKVLPDDIDLLNEFGYRIKVIHGKPNKYYVAEHRFSQAEATIFSDALIASKLDKKQKKEVIGKWIDIISESQADQIDKHVIVKELPKRGNDRILSSIETISSAIENNHKVAFRYFSLDENKHRVYKVRKDGSQIYSINPITMMWDRDNYYLVFYYDNHEETQRYRIDRMDDVAEETIERQFHPALQSFNTEEYRRQLFSMFGGELYNVRITFKKEMLNDIYDHYGEDVVIWKKDEDWYSAVIKVQVGKTFFGWVAGTGGCVRIESPEEVHKQFKDYLTEIYKAYCE